ncbi:MAG: ABC transporter ATP-binding protein [Chloroflexi bacterium]|nr:ABC transporter ATP-binding protein [Chloroflexota bacterium]
MIRLEKLRKEFGDVVAVDDIDLEIREAEFTCIIGPSGSGKSTTLRLVAGLEKPTSGTIYIADRDVTRVPPHKRNVPMVWQLFVLFPHLNVRQNIEYGLTKRGIGRKERRKRVEKIAETLGVERFLDRWTNELSGGEQQRVGLARALVLEPPVLLLDEPLGSLDAALGLAVQSELKDLQQRSGITFVYVTHNQSEALAMADRIVVMNEGKIVQIGSGTDLTDHPGGRFVADFVGQNNVVDGTVVSNDGSNVQVRCPLGSVWGRVLSSEKQLTGPVAYAISADRMRLASSEADASKEGETGAAADSPNIIKGVVRGEEYRGVWTTIVVEVNGTMIRASVPSEERPSLGEPVALSWSSEDAMVIPI